MYSIETKADGKKVNVKVFIDGVQKAETTVIGTEQEAKEYAEKVFLKDLRRNLGWSIALPGDPIPPAHLTEIDSVKVYWYDFEEKPRYRPVTAGDEAYDSDGVRIYGYDTDGSVLYAEKVIEKVVKPKPLEVVDNVRVYYYLLNKTPVFKPMSVELSKGVKGYTFSGKALSGYDENGDIVYVEALKEV